MFQDAIEMRNIEMRLIEIRDFTVLEKDVKAKLHGQERQSRE